MRREYTKEEQSYIDWLKSLGCKFYAPLTENDLTDNVNGVSPTYGTGSHTWDASAGAWEIKTTARSQNCLMYNIPNIGNMEPSYKFTGCGEVYLKSYNGTCDFLSLGTGFSDRSNAVSLIETHRYNGLGTSSWHKAAVTVSGTTVLFYLDGSLNKTSTTSTYMSLNVSRWTNYSTCADNVVIGKVFNSYTFDAYVRNIMMFNDALDLATIRKIQGYE